ncbi:MAG: molybdopterin-dependent oxidoreductase [Thermoanaerobaculia bacterium]|nr:MAG: molybdopterin-dependent oxidoreductase [Thermoanaerobaculia bacterium]MBZ0101748.1 molybdopterin-dependent oxidoreductase [Thermoanaerobaculia bacterium]
MPEAILRTTACPLDCPDACTLEVTVEGDRLARVAGARTGNPVTDGFICGKVRRLPEHVHGEARLRQPMRRKGAKGSGRFEPISWDAALDLAAARLVETRDRFGGAAILPYSYGGSNGQLTQDTTDALLFRRLGASALARTVCAAPSGRAATGLYGKMPGVAYTDYPEARLIVVWGANPRTSGVHLVPWIHAARQRGARLVVVDPRVTSLAAQADLHLAPRPGTDVVLALAVIRELFASGRADREFLRRHARGHEELERRAARWSLEAAAEVCGLESGEIARFAELYAASSPAIVRCGWGVERNRNGGSAVAAILALPAVAGKFGVRGGGYTMSNSGAWKFAAFPVGDAPPPPRTINMNLLGEALRAEAEPPVRLLFVYNSNALATTPDQNAVRRGLAREDLFTVVFDAVATDTAAWADLLLPATTFVEHRELSRGYGAYALQLGEPVLPAVGEARGNYRVFGDLAVRCGVARREEIPAEAAWVEALLDSTGKGDALRAELAERGLGTPPDGEAPVQFVDVFPRTADRRVDLVPDELDREAPEGLYAFRAEPQEARYPLALISPASDRTTSSTFGQLHEGEVAARLHPRDAAARGIADGARIRMFNPLGEVICRARLSESLRPGVVELPKGLWQRHTENGSTACALAPATLTDLGGGACFNDARVEVEALP